MSEFAELNLEGKVFKLPVIEGTEQEKGVDISKLRGESGFITVDTGYKNTGATQSSITFLDGEKGILRYRGYSIEALAEKLNMQCVNLAMSGAGNEYIYSTLLDYITTNDTNNIGLVIAAWTQNQRKDYQQENHAPPVC